MGKLTDQKYVTDKCEKLGNNEHDLKDGRW